MATPAPPPTIGENCDLDTFKLSEELTKILVSACGFIIALSVNAFFQNVFSYITVGGATLGLFINMVISIILFLTLAAVVVVWFRPFLCKHVDKLATRHPEAAVAKASPSPS